MRGVNSVFRITVYYSHLVSILSESSMQLISPAKYREDVSFRYERPKAAFARRLVRDFVSFDNDFRRSYPPGHLLALDGELRGVFRELSGSPQMEPTKPEHFTTVGGPDIMLTRPSRVAAIARQMLSVDIPPRSRYGFPRRRRP